MLFDVGYLLTGAEVIREVTEMEERKRQSDENKRLVAEKKRTKEFEKWKKDEEKESKQDEMSTSKKAPVSRKRKTMKHTTTKVAVLPVKSRKKPKKTATIPAFDVPQFVLPPFNPLPSIVVGQPPGFAP